VAAARPQLRVEAHLLDFSGELYGAELEVELGAKLRDERKFSSPAELREQIQRDVAAVRAAT
jgi:riboflavin kinase/FMN adenylyltransferase